jgi:hypothetical protein
VTLAVTLAVALTVMQRGEDTLEMRRRAAEQSVSSTKDNCGLVTVLGCQPVLY